MQKEIITEKTGVIDNSLIRPHPLNKELYDFKEDDRTNLQADMSEYSKLQEGRKHGNSEALEIDIYGYIHSGERRYRSAEEVGIKCSKYELIPNNEAFDPDNYDEFAQLEGLEQRNDRKGTSRNERRFSVCVPKFHRIDISWIKSRPLEVNKSSIKKRREAFANKHNHTPAHFKKALELFSEGRIDLLKKIDDGKDDMTIGKAHDSVFKNPWVYNPNKFNHVNLIKKDNLNIESFLDNAFNWIKKITGHTFKSKNKNITIEHDELGFEIFATAGMISHGVATSYAITLDDYKKLGKVRTAAKKGMTPDIQCIDLTVDKRKINPKFEAETLEVKFCTWNGSQTGWSGGPGFKLQNPKYYILGMTHANSKKIWMVMTLLTQEDIDSIKSGSFTFKNWAKNHHGKDDYDMLAGDFFCGNTQKNKFDPIWEDIK
jgi:hypothetical protein